MKISLNGSWLNETAEGHIFDLTLANALIVFCKEHQCRTVIDLGCGEGRYIRTFLKAGLHATGYDGNPNTPKLTGGHGLHLELHTPLKVAIDADLVLSLEVGEHIPRQYEGVFLDNVVQCARRWIVLSWAVPDQPGDGHVNCKTNQHIMTAMGNRGYAIQSPETRQLRKRSQQPWFKHTLMVFLKM